MAVILLSLVTLLLVGCGGSDSSGPSAAPEITNLRAEQGRSATGGQIIMTVDVLDRDADVFGGQCVLATNIGTVTSTISGLNRGVDPSAKVATVTCGATYTGTGGQIVGRRDHSATRRGSTSSTRSCWATRSSAVLRSRRG